MIAIMPYENTREPPQTLLCTLFEWVTIKREIFYQNDKSLYKYSITDKRKNSKEK